MSSLPSEPIYQPGSTDAERRSSLGANPPLPCSQPADATRAPLSPFKAADASVHGLQMHCDSLERRTLTRVGSC